MSTNRTHMNGTGPYRLTGDPQSLAPLAEVQSRRQQGVDLISMQHAGQRTVHIHI